MPLPRKNTGRRPPRRLQRESALFALAILMLLTQAGQTAAPAHAQDRTARPAASGRVAVVSGYHGYNAPLLERALVPRGAQVVPIQGWLPPARYSEFGVVVIDGSLKNARIEPNEFTVADLPVLKQYLDSGGTLVLLHQGAVTLNTPHGRELMAKWWGASPAGQGDLRVQRDHPWVRHLKDADTSGWLTASLGRPMSVTAGSGIIEPRPGLSLLQHARVGQGQVIYVGWDLFRYRPQTRSGITPQQERGYNDQTAILDAIAADLFPQLPQRIQPRMLFDHPYELEPARQMSVPPAPPSDRFASHAPMRPLPTPSTRPLGEGVFWHVDPVKGDDSNDGTEARPWKSVQHGARQLKPGHTLLLRGGVYHEHVTLDCGGEPGKPVTIRSYPGELAILDGSFPEFALRPEQAWEPAPGGSPDEFRSTATFPDLVAQPDVTNVLGWFADSMVPLHGYRFLTDLRSEQRFWTIPSNVGKEGDVYCGPGLWFDLDTKRIHCRLAHTRLEGLHESNYRGETDPRRIPLLVAGEESTLTIVNARHVRLLDLVVRGSKGSTISVATAADVLLDGLTIYTGRTGMLVEYTQGLRVIHCAFRGVAAPWSFRSHLKYRAIEAQVFTASKWQPTGNSDFELAYCEFTDSVDGIFIGNVHELRFHHNLVDNFSDDAIFVTAMSDDGGQIPGGWLLIYQNRISRCLTVLSFGAGHGRQTVSDGGTHTGAGVWFCRNLVDLRQPVWVQVPAGSDQPQEFTAVGRSQGDHGSPVWEPLFLYHNTIIAAGPAWRNYYLHGWGQSCDSVRVLLNNLMAQVAGEPGVAIMDKPLVLVFDGNLHHSLAGGGESPESFASRLNQSVRRVMGDRPADLASVPTPLRNPVTPGSEMNPVEQLLGSAGEATLRGQHDRVGDPRFARWSSDWREPADFRIAPPSAAIDAGVPVPDDWFDPVRTQDAGPPDAGAFPAGHAGWRVGVGGRFHAHGDLP